MDLFHFLIRPRTRLILGLGNTGFGHDNRFGFNINMRNQEDGYYFESDFRQGNIKGFTTIDAQISYKFPSTRSILKLVEPIFLINIIRQLLVILK